MKKLLSLWLVCIMLTTLLPLQALAEGETTEMPPQGSDGYYLLDSVEDLYWFSSYVNGRTEQTTEVNARLTADIDLNPGVSFAYNRETGKITVSSGAESFYLGSGLNGTTLGTLDSGETAFALNKWTPIGTKDMPYAGTFDGGGHTIDGIYVNDETISYAGLFGYIGDPNGNKTFSGHVQNLTVGADSLILGYKFGSSGSTGGVAAAVSSVDTIKDCVNRATVAGKSSTTGFNTAAARSGMVGGIAGYISGSAQNCENYGTVVSDNYVGGIAGNLTGVSGLGYLSLVNCRNYGSVYADETAGCAGGIAGNSGGNDTTGNNGGLIQGCMNFGVVRGYGAAGILYHSRRYATVQFCANRGKVEATGTASGLVGYLGWSYSYLYASYNAGEVAVTGSSESAKAYPLAGKVHQYFSSFASHAVEKCYNDSTVFPCEDGALAGENITLTNCRNVPTSVFASGEAAYNMWITGSALWRQNLEEPYEEGKIPETYPNTTGTRSVSYITHYCCHTDTTNKNAHKTTLYSNSRVDITDEHEVGADGKCTHCGIDARKPIFLADTLSNAKVGQNYSAYIYVSADTPSLKGDISAVAGENDNTAYTFGKGLTGTANYTWSSGYYYTISGIPTETGTLSFALSATNTNGTTVKPYTITIDPADPLEIKTDGKLSNATVGEAYSKTLSVNSAFSASWSLEEGSALPAGLTLDEKSKAISGTPTTEGEYSFTVKASCGGQTATKQFTLTVLPEGGCKHDKMTVIKGTAATCQKDGVADYYYCGTCGYYFYDANGENQIYGIDYARNYELKTAAMHTDENKDGNCDFCSKPMPIFKKVTQNKELVYGGTYIFVAEIGGKYYVLTALPKDAKSGEREYVNIMGVAEIVPGENGVFAFNDLSAAEAMMLKTEFAAMSGGELDAGLPRYGFSTVFGNMRYGLDGSYDCYYLQANYPAKYGYRIAFEEDQTVKIASVYNEWWGIGSSDGKSDSKSDAASLYGILRAFDMTYNDEHTKFMTMQTESYYNGEKQMYGGAAMTEYPIYLYKMTDIGTAGTKTYTVTDSSSAVNTDAYPGMSSNYAGVGLSNVSGLNNAISYTVVNNAVSDTETEQTSLTVEAYAQIAVTSNKTEADGKGNETVTALTYSVTPYIRISGTDGAEIANRQISDSDLTGAPLTVTLHTGGIYPEQVIHYKNDGTKEFFYPSDGKDATGETKTFAYEEDYNGNGFVTVTVTDFSEIEILAEAKPESESEYSISYDGKSLTVICGKSGNYALVFANYDKDGKMTAISILPQDFNAGTNDYVEIPKDISLGTGSKIFLWQSISTLKPLCEAFEVK